VPDEHGIAITIENLVQGDGIGDQRTDPRAGVVRDRGRGTAAQDRRHRMKARLGQHGQQMPSGVGAVGEAAEAQRQRAGPGLQQPNVKLVRPHHADPSHPWRDATTAHRRLSKQGRGRSHLRARFGRRSRFP
jgi:hypothetical protein